MDETLKTLAEDNYAYEEIKLKITEEQDAIAEKYEKDIAEIRADEESNDVLEESEEELAAADEETPEFDVYLREALRVTRDWVALNTGKIDPETLEFAAVIQAEAQEIDGAPKL